MTTLIDKSNPILAIVGDGPDVFLITMQNNAGYDFIDPTTQLVVPAGAELTFQLKGTMGMEQFKSNIAQINELANFEKLTYTLDPVDSVDPLD